jgi:hypothetical protein
VIWGMKVYIACYASGHETCIMAVFSTEEKAQQYFVNHGLYNNYNYWVEEVEVDAEL